MKYLLTTILCYISLGLSAQNESNIVVYEQIYSINGKGILKRQLSLYSDGTFLFHSYRRINDQSPEENKYGKGTWTSKNDLLLFTADEVLDIDKKYTLNFNQSKARIFKDSSIRFLSSKIPWGKGMKLSKKSWNIKKNTTAIGNV